MRFLMLIRTDEQATLSNGPDEAMGRRINALVDEMKRAGVLLDTGALAPTGEGVRVRRAYGKETITDGPFTEAKEIVGGYFLLETRTKEDAVQWTSRFLAAHSDEWNVECELRRLSWQAETA
jgi:hypothetical protein